MEQQQFYEEIKITEVFEQTAEEQDIQNASQASEYLVEEPTDEPVACEEEFYVKKEENGSKCESFECYSKSRGTLENHLIKGITLSKWPGVGFGFKLAKCSDKDYFMVKEIEADSPAESCLKVGDLVIEIDEFEPYDKFGNLDEFNGYLSERDNIHLTALNESDYNKFKSLNMSLSNYSSNCEDIVIVSWHQMSKNFS
jgi:hypothetical protein